jgi:hypothetical protein
VLIEYKISFQADGVTIAQRVEPGSYSTNGMKPSAGTSSNAVVQSGNLGASVHDTSGGDAGGAEIGPGGNPPGQQPIIVFGPTIIGCGVYQAVDVKAQDSGNQGAAGAKSAPTAMPERRVGSK